MLDFDQIQTILEIHGKSLHSSKEEVRTILLSAGCDETEIQKILFLCPAEPDKKKTRTEGLHRLFRTDVSLSSSEISALLGINVRITEPPKHVAVTKKKPAYCQMVAVSVITILLAIVGLIFGMYAAEIGPFHKTVSASFVK